MVARNSINIYMVEVKIFSDHKPLQYTIKKTLASAPSHIQRLLIRLQKYIVNVEFLPGKFLHIADTLSRTHLSDIDDDNTITEDFAIMIHTVALNLPISQTKMETLKESTNNDPKLVMLKEYIKEYIERLLT